MKVLLIYGLGCRTISKIFADFSMPWVSILISRWVFHFGCFSCECWAKKRAWNDSRQLKGSIQTSHLLCPAPEGLYGAFNIKMLLKKHPSVSSTALPGASVISSKEPCVYFWWDSAPFTPSLVFSTAFQALHLIRRINTSQWQSLPSLWMECN